MRWAPRWGRRGARLRGPSRGMAAVDAGSMQSAAAHLPMALSIVGSVASTVALYMAVRAFARSRKFRDYVDREDDHNLQALEALLRGCAKTISRVLADPGDEGRYFRSLNALLLVLPGALAEYEVYIKRESRRLALDLELLLDASTLEYSGSIRLLGGAEDHVRKILESLDKPPAESRPPA